MFTKHLLLSGKRRCGRGEVHSSGEEKVTCVYVYYIMLGTVSPVGQQVAHSARQYTA